MIKLFVRGIRNEHLVAHIQVPLGRFLGLPCYNLSIYTDCGGLIPEPYWKSSIHYFKNVGMDNAEVNMGTP